MRLTPDSLRLSGIRRRGRRRNYGISTRIKLLLLEMMLRLMLGLLLLLLVVLVM
jgi:hypothetical protein